MTPHAWIMIEHAARTAMPTESAGWQRTRTYPYGDSAMTLYHPLASAP
jgi:16S rRNA G966 N2-methylase RsmD